VSDHVIWICLAACLDLVHANVLAQRALITTARVNLHAGPRRSSPVKSVLPRHTKVAWNGAMADGEGMLRVTPPHAPRSAGWVTGEYLVEPALGAGSPDGSSRGCGVLRWPVKTLSDADAAAVNRTPQDATIALLRAFPAPKVRPQNGRANWIEKTESAVSGNVIMWGLEPDGDLHLVLDDGSNSGQTIVLEVPDPSCLVGTTPDVQDSIAKARHDVLQALGPPPSGVTALSAPVPVAVTGIGFFDFGHSTGHPPNAFELHPMLSIRIGQRALARARRSRNGPAWFLTDAARGRSSGPVLQGDPK
jgi:hypothetical protein